MMKGRIIVTKITYRTAESVSTGHPDSLTDYIVNSILDAILEQDKNSRVAIDGVFKDKYLTLGGEITTTANINYKEVVKEALVSVGYSSLAEELVLTTNIFEQSPDIALGTNDEVQGAGDQGTITGYACSGNIGMIPLEKYLADSIMRRLFTEERFEYPWMKPDMKSQVTLRYEDGRPFIDTVLVAVQHDESVSHEQVKLDIRDILEQLWVDLNLPSEMYCSVIYIVNGTGLFTIGGPKADSGEVGRKIVVDAYGVSVPVGGGTFNGKDATKVDRSAAYYARYVAKHVVSTGLVDECLITVSYAIGHTQPLSVQFDLKLDGKPVSDFISQPLIAACNQIFDFSPKNMIEELYLKEAIYADTCVISHFGTKFKRSLVDNEIITVPWEDTPRLQELKDSFKMALFDKLNIHN